MLFISMLILHILELYFCAFIPCFCVFSLCSRVLTLFILTIQIITRFSNVVSYHPHFTTPLHFWIEIARIFSLSSIILSTESAKRKHSDSVSQPHSNAKIPPHWNFFSMRWFLFLLHCFYRSRHFFFILFWKIQFCFPNDHFSKCNDCDQVWNDHQRIRDICKKPDWFQR